MKLKSSEMYNIRANEDYKCVCEEPGTTIYLCLLLVEKGGKEQSNEIAVYIPQKDENKRKVKKALFEGAKLLIAMLIGMLIFICLEGRMPLF